MVDVNVVLKRLAAVLAVGVWCACVSGCKESQRQQGGPTGAPVAKTDGGPAATQADSAVPPGMKVIELKLPKPVFAGTPKNVPPGTTVAPPTGRPRGPLCLPADAVNLSLHRPATCSEAAPIIGSAKLVTDGDKEAADGSYLELGPALDGPQWVQVDLGRPCVIYAVLLWQFHGDPRVYHDVVVQSADDADFSANVQTLFNNDQDNSSGLGLGRDREYFELYEGKLIAPAGEPIRGRYVRVYSAGSTADEMNRFTEVEVYGRPAD